MNLKVLVGQSRMVGGIRVTWYNISFVRKYTSGEREKESGSDSKRCENTEHRPFRRFKRYLVERVGIVANEKEKWDSTNGKGP